MMHKVDQEAGSSEIFMLHHRGSGVEEKDAFFIIFW